MLVPLAQAAMLMLAKSGKLVPTPLEKSMLSDARQGSLLAILFHLEKNPDSRIVAPHYYRKAALFDRMLGFKLKWIWRRAPVIDAGSI